MFNGIRASNPHGLDKGHGLKFCVGSEFDKRHLKKARRHITQNVVNITIKMKTIVQNPEWEDIEKKNWKIEREREWVRVKCKRKK